MNACRHRYESGSILIVSLWAVTLLALLAASLTTRARFGVRQEAWRDLDSEGRAMLEAMAAASIARLKADSDVEYDAYTDAWARPFEARASDFAPDGAATPEYWSDYRIRVHAIDESGKININFASESLLLAAVRGMSDVDSPDALVAAIIDWRDADDAGFAERDHYAAKDPPYRPANGDFTHPAELLYVDGVTPAMYFGEDANRNGRLDPVEDDGDLFPPYDNSDGILETGLESMFTVYGDGVINANGVSEAVLRAVLSLVLSPVEASEKAAQIIRMRKGGDAIDGTDDDRPFADIAALSEALGQAVYNRLLSADVQFDVASQAIRFVHTVELRPRNFHATAEVVALREEDELRVLSWHEYR